MAIALSRALDAAILGAKGNSFMPGKNFLKLGDIKGDSTDPQHKGEMEIESFSLNMVGMSRARPRDPRETPRHEDASVTKVVDGATPKLQEAVAKGRHFQKAVISMTSSNGKLAATCVLSDVMISDYRVENSRGAAGEPTLVESFSLNYSKVEMIYNVPDESEERYLWK